MTTRILIFFLFALSSVALDWAQEKKPQGWQELIRNNKCEEARKLCAGWTTSSDISKQIEGHKCLANVSLCGAETVALQATDAGGIMTSSYMPAAVDAALVHLDQALELAPQDLSIHKGRLHVLEISFRYSDMVKALDESCTIYSGPEGIQAWLAYTEELFDAKQFRVDLAFLEVLNKHYPNSHEVLGNIGAMHLMLREDEQGLPYLLKAAELDPGDHIDAWNLGRTYDYMGKTELADQWYTKALALEPDSEAKKDRVCVYAQFVEKQLREPTRACELQKVNCNIEKQSACSVAK